MAKGKIEMTMSMSPEMEAAIENHTAKLIEIKDRLDGLCGTISSTTINLKPGESIGFIHDYKGFAEWLCENLDNVFVSIQGSDDPRACDMMAYATLFHLNGEVKLVGPCQPNRRDALLALYEAIVEDKQ